MTDTEIFKCKDMIRCKLCGKWIIDENINLYKHLLLEHKIEDIG